jgi:hypothetical protein
LGPDQDTQTGSVTLSDSTSPQFANYQGITNNYATFNFTVGTNQQRLDASIAYPGNPANGNNARVRLILVSPQHKLAAHSLPQGVGNFGNVDVISPQPGTWEGVIFGDVAAVDGTNGSVPWQVSTQQFVPFGSVSPSHFPLAPGQSRTFSVNVDSPATPGDSTGSIVVVYGARPTGVASLPVTVRSLVQVGGGNSGAFSGVLTGGNGRANGEGQIEYYQFQVGAGEQNITANVSLTNDISDVVGAYLVSPDGDTLGYGENYLATGVNNTTGAIEYTPEQSLTAYTLSPVAGTWTLVIDVSGAIVGDEVSQPFSGDIELNDVSVNVPGLPDSAAITLRSGIPVVVPVNITNNGASAADFFVDGRLNETTTVALAPLDAATGVSLPLTQEQPLWLMPTHTSAVAVTATSSLPTMFDYGPIVGDPDLASSASGPGALCTTSSEASFTPADGSVTAGVWDATPSECGPYPAPAPAGTVSMQMTATIQEFDPAVTSAPGDFWQLAVNPSASFGLYVIQPGQTATIDVTITPGGASGSVVSGNLYVDTFEPDVAPYGQETGDELTALPYEYTIG